MSERTLFSTSFLLREYSLCPAAHSNTAQMVQVQGLTLLRRGFQGRNCVRGGQPHGARRVSGYSAWYGLQHESNSFQVSPVITHFAVRHPCVRLLRLWFFLQGTCQPRHGYLQICKMRLFSVSVSAHPLAASF